ncbi:MAG: hypothetical protein GXY83_14025 [Rhodopirellula sp.]|nr:hypothetical protein [Rhodopirellula sp.]
MRYLAGAAGVLIAGMFAQGCCCNPGYNQPTYAQQSPYAQQPAVYLPQAAAQNYCQPQLPVCQPQAQPVCPPGCVPAQSPAVQ